MSSCRSRVPYGLYGFMIYAILYQGSEKYGGWYHFGNQGPLFLKLQPAEPPWSGKIYPNLAGVVHITSGASATQSGGWFHI